MISSVYDERQDAFKVLNISGSSGMSLKIINGSRIEELAAKLVEEGFREGEVLARQGAGRFNWLVGLVGLIGLIG